MSSNRDRMRHIRAYRLWVFLYAVIAFTSIAVAQNVTPGEPGKLKGKIVARNGDEIRVQDDKTGSLATVVIGEATKIRRTKYRVVFLRHTEMDVTALVPGLTISAEGKGNSSGQLEASRITFSPDEFAIEVAEEEQIKTNKSTAEQAQWTANQGVAAVGAAQSSADQAQASADQAASSAQTAGGIAVVSAFAADMINTRVSDLDDYKTVAEAAVYFPTDKYALNDAAKADLDTLANLALSTSGYMIEIAGYASKTGPKDFNQQLSENRATAVADYLRNEKSIPIRRIIAPVGYGSTHPDAPNDIGLGRAINQRVDVKLIVNKGLQGGS